LQFLLLINNQRQVDYHPTLRVLYVSPHTRFFIGDQMMAVEKLVGGIDVLLPSPYFSGLVIRLPLARNRFASLRRARESRPGATGRIIRARYFDIPGRYGRNLTSAFASRSALSTVSREHPEFSLVHSHFIGLNGLIGSEIKERYGVPLVVTAYGGDAYSLPFGDSYRRKMATSVISRADRLIAASRPMVENLVNLGADRGKIRVIATGYDATFRPSSKDESRARLSLPASKVILLTVANLVPQKGHSYLLEAFSRLSRSRPDLFLVLVGGGELEAALRKKATDLGLKDNIMFTGPLPHEQIPVWMCACDLFVLPSVNEGTPTVIPEAMACGRPIVATRVGGVPDVVSDDSVGYLVSANDEVALSDAILRALGKKWDQGEIVKRALPYSWDSVAGEIVKVYREVAPG